MADVGRITTDTYTRAYTRSRKRFHALSVMDMRVSIALPHPPIDPSPLIPSHSSFSLSLSLSLSRRSVRASSIRPSVLHESAFGRDAEAAGSKIRRDKWLNGSK